MTKEGPLRVTIMLDAALATTLRAKQAKQLVKKGKSVSFSKVINDALKKSLHTKPVKKVKKHSSI